MIAEKKKFKTVDEYISSFPKDMQVILENVRKQIKKSAPEADERISYNIPAYFENGILVYFAGYRNHIGLYALPSGNKAFQKELSKYKTGKGSMQFPIDQPMPFKLIDQIIKFRIIENVRKSKTKK